MMNPRIRKIPPHEKGNAFVNLSEIVGSRRFDVKGLEGDSPLCVLCVSVVVFSLTSIS